MNNNAKAIEWIIGDTDKFKYHTDLSVLLQPIIEDISDYKWLVSDLNFITDDVYKIPLDFEKDWFLLNYNDIQSLIDSNTQIIWGVFSAINKDFKLEFTDEMLPYADGNSSIWENQSFQIDKSEIEIIAWDSSYTIVKFKDAFMSKKFKDYFDEAIDLEVFKREYLKRT